MACLNFAIQKNDFKPQKQTQKNILHFLQRFNRCRRLIKQKPIINLVMKFATNLKTSFILCAAIMLFSVTAFAQASKNVSVKSFNNITISSGMDLYLTQGNAENVVVKGSSDAIKDVIVEQSGTGIRIKYKEGVNWGRIFKGQSIKVYVTYKSLKSISATGGSDVYTENILKGDVLNLTASGGSDLKLSLAVKDLSLTVSGGSDAALKGSAENMQASASGGSDIDAFEFAVNNAKVHVTGGSDANINVNKALEASATGGSDVSYKGNAVLKLTSSSKSGDVRRVK